jgi:hypothetical protein
LSPRRRDQQRPAEHQSQKNRPELVAIILAFLVARILILEGTSNWLEGLMLVAVDLMLGVGFFYAPGTPPTRHHHGPRSVGREVSTVLQGLDRKPRQHSSVR